MTAGLVTLAVVVLAAVAWTRWRLVTITVRGTSMRPALEPGDRVLIRRTRRPAAARLRRGQIVVAVPGQPGRAIDHRHPLLIIKRVFAVPGDPVPRLAVPALEAAPEAYVPPGRLVLLGDNPAGTDSRQIGYFHADYLLGVVIRRLPGR